MTPTCVACGKAFARTFSSLQRVCGPRCAVRTVATAKRAKAAQAKLERQADAAAAERLKTLPQLKAEAAKWMHLWVRLRDQDAGCISCRNPLPGAAVGGAFDAGHYRSVGSAKHLQFDVRNVHGQCKRCNQYLGGDPVRYRIGLIARIGAAEVEALELDEAPRKLTRNQVRELRDHYRDLATALKKTQKKLPGPDDFVYDGLV